MGSPLLTADLIGPSLLGGPQWGIFGPSGQPIIVADSVDNVGYSRDYRISNYPQEQGAFMTYNKVKIPFDAKVGFLSNRTRVELLNSLEQIAASLDFVVVVMPEISYPSGNIVHYDFMREEYRGKTLIRVMIWIQEVRIVAASAAENTQSTNAASPTQSGQVQAEVPPQPNAISPTSNPAIVPPASETITVPPAAPVNSALPPLPALQIEPTSDAFQGPF